MMKQVTALRGVINNIPTHCNDVIMGAKASQITSLMIFTQPFIQAQIKEKNQSSASLAFVTGEFPAQMASNAENVAIWWRHHADLSPQEQALDPLFWFTITVISGSYLGQIGNLVYSEIVTT